MPTQPERLQLRSWPYIALFDKISILASGDPG